MNFSDNSRVDKYSSRAIRVEVTLLRCVKYCAMSLILTGVLLVAFVSPSFAAVKAVQTYVDSTWSNVIYYVASLSGKYGQENGYDDVTVSITAVDEYTLYVNGVMIGSDNNWETVETYTPISINSNVINIAVKVVNHGRSEGNGLIVDIDTGSTDIIGTSTTIRKSELISGELKNVPIAWWTFDEKAKNDELGFGDNNWYIFDQTMFTQTNITRLMKRAMLGRIGNVNYSFSPAVEVITGYLHTNVDIGYTEGGGISLRRIEGENIALQKDSEAPDKKLTDGDLTLGYEYVSNPLNDTKYVDLGKIYRVNEMTLFTGREVNKYELRSIRGYSVEISLDRFRWEEVGVIHGIGESIGGKVNEGGYDNYSVEFPPEWARYLRYNITEVRIDMPMIGEMMVYGEGYILEGKYESPWINFDSPNTPKNFDTVEWEGIVPDGTSITIQTQTVNSLADTSEWSDPTQLQSFSFASPEPATSFRYRVNLESQVGTISPTLKNLSVKYSIVDQPVTYTDGYISEPAVGTVAMGADSTFVYTLSYNLAPGQNLKSLAISVPVRATLNYVYRPASDINLALDEVNTYSTIDTLYVTLADSLTSAGVDTLLISFNTTLYKSYHTFEAFLYNSTMNDGAGGIKVWENKDLGSNTVNVDKYLKEVLIDVKAFPKVLTPNNDNKNDFTVFEFTLAKVQTNVVIKVFNTDGSLVTVVCDEFMGPNKYSVETAAEAVNMPGYWAGKDEDGELVPPGIYVYQVIADTDEGGVIKGGTVVVAY